MITSTPLLTAWAPELDVIAARRKALEAEMRDLDLQERAAQAGSLCWLPPVSPGMSDREVINRLDRIVRRWPDAPRERLAFLAEICPAGDREAYLLLRRQLRAWIAELARRQRRMRAASRCACPSPDTLSLVRRNRRLITRLIQVRRASRRYAGSMAELATSL